MHIHILKTFDDLGTSYQAGQKLHVPTSLGERYVFAGVAERVKYRSYVDRLQAEEAERQRSLPQATAKVMWSVKKGPLTERYGITAHCSRPNCSVFSYDGDPNVIRNNHGQIRGTLEQQEFIHSCGGASPEKVPANICTEYRRVKKSENISTVGLDEVNYYKNCQKSKGDGEPVDLHAPQVIHGVVVGPPMLSDHPVNPKHNNYGKENFQPNLGDGQKANLSELSPVFKKQ